MNQRIINPGQQLANLIDRPHRQKWGWPRLPLGTEEHHQRLRASAVLILTKPVKGEDVAFLLVRRSCTSRYHPGEFAFPGGGIEPEESPQAAAMRECYEESGIPLNQKHILGTLPALALLASGNVVTPVLAWLDETGQEQLPQDWQDHEIQSSHWVTRSYLADPARRTTVMQGKEWVGPGFPLADGCIWGFTANVLDWLLRELEWDQPAVTRSPVASRANRYRKTRTSS